MKAKTIVLAICLVSMIGAVAVVGHAHNAVHIGTSPITAGMPYEGFLGEGSVMPDSTLGSAEATIVEDDLLSIFDINAQFKTAYLRKRLICTSV